MSPQVEALPELVPLRVVYVAGLMSPFYVIGALNITVISSSDLPHLTDMESNVVDQKIDLVNGW